MKLVVVCPGGAVTGGPEALHQLVAAANRFEDGSAAILYYPFHQEHVTPEPYVRYAVPKILRHRVPDEAVVVLPEIWPEMAHTFRNRCALWWLSVDNFGSHGQRNLDRIWVHLCQTEYSWRHVEGLGERLRLFDWVDVELVEVERLRRIAVNPVKDSGLMVPFRTRVPFEVVEVRGLSRVGVAEMLRGSMMYVDFGHHPGCDRLPREAALAGCTVFSTRLGSARFQEDMPLPDWYKFDSVDELLEKVGLVFGDGDVPSQESYRAWVRGNREVFEAEVESLLRWVG